MTVSKYDVILGEVRESDPVTVPGYPYVSITDPAYGASTSATGAANRAAVLAAAAACKNTRNILLIPDGGYPVSAALDLRDVPNILGLGVLVFTGTDGVTVGMSGTDYPDHGQTNFSHISLRVAGNGTANTCGILVVASASADHAFEVSGFTDPVKYAPPAQFAGYCTSPMVRVNDCSKALTLVPPAGMWVNENVFYAVRTHGTPIGVFADASAGAARDSQVERNLFFFPSLEGCSTALLDIRDAWDNMFFLPRTEGAGPAIFRGLSWLNNVILPWQDMTTLYNQNADGSVPSDISPWPNFVFPVTGLEFDEVVHLTYEDFVLTGAAAGHGYACVKPVFNYYTGVPWVDDLAIDTAAKTFKPGGGGGYTVLAFDVPVAKEDLFHLDYNLIGAVPGGGPPWGITCLDASKAPLGTLSSGDPYLCADARFTWGGNSGTGNVLTGHEFFKRTFGTFKVARPEVKFIRVSLANGAEYVDVKLRKIRDVRSSAKMPAPHLKEQTPRVVAGMSGLVPKYFGEIVVLQSNQDSFLGLFDAAGNAVWKPWAGNSAGSGGNKTRTITTPPVSAIGLAAGEAELIVDLTSVGTFDTVMIQLTPSPVDGQTCQIRFGGTITNGNPVLTHAKYYSRFTSIFVIDDVIGGPTTGAGVTAAFNSGEVHNWTWSTQHPSYTSGAWFFTGYGSLAKLDTSSFIAAAQKGAAGGVAGLGTDTRLLPANTQLAAVPPASGGNYQLFEGITVIDPASPLAAQPTNLALPLSPTDGSTVEVVFGGTIAFGSPLNSDSPSGYFRYASRWNGSAWVYSDVYGVPNGNDILKIMSGERHRLVYRSAPVAGWYFYSAQDHAANRRVLRLTDLSAGFYNASCNDNRTIILDPASAASAFTLNITGTPADGTTVRLVFGGTITSGAVVTTLTLGFGTGTLVPAGTFTASVGTAANLEYSAPAGKWHRS